MKEVLKLKMKKLSRNVVWVNDSIIFRVWILVRVFKYWGLIEIYLIDIINVVFNFI